MPPLSLNITYEFHKPSTSRASRVREAKASGSLARMAFLHQLPELRLIRAGAKGAAREEAFVAWRKCLRGFASGASWSAPCLEPGCRKAIKKRDITTSNTPDPKNDRAHGAEARRSRVLVLPRPEKVRCSRDHHANLHQNQN